MARRKTVLDGLLYMVNIALALPLLVAYLAYYVDPELTTVVAFFGLAYPVLLLFNLLFVCYWALRFKRKILLSLVVIGIGAFHLTRTYRFDPGTTLANPGETLKVMSFNVRMYNQYKWLKDDGVYDKIKALVAAEDPDILAIQEHFYGKEIGDFGYPYQMDQQEGKQKVGLVLFSKIPFKDSGEIHYGPGPNGEDAGRSLYVDLEYQGETLRVFNAHLASVGFKKEDYQLLEHPNDGSKEKLKNGVLKIVGQLHRAFEKRAHQVKILAQAVSNSPHPVLLLGDLNDTPQSFAYHQLNKELQDAYLTAGSGFQRTYAKGPIPFRIDHVFSSDTLEALEYGVIPQALSDHYPVTATFHWRANAVN